jgi:internalin A
MKAERTLCESSSRPGLCAYGVDQLSVAEHRLDAASRDGAKTLDLSDLQLAHLPEELFADFPGLCALNLRGNRLTGLPASLMHLSDLQELWLGGNDFEHLPEFIGRLVHLKTLALSSNPLPELPEWIGDLCGLEVLEAANLFLTGLPASIGDLLHLRQLRLESNLLATVPECIAALTELEVLGLQDNKLSSLPSFVVALQSMRELWVGRNLLTEFPPECDRLANLRTLDLHSNMLSALPDAVTRMTSLEVLMLYGNQLAGLPAEMGNLRHLRDLLLTDNQLKSLPDSIGNLHTLERLSLFNNALETLPDTLQGLTSLESLHVNFNKLRHLPSSIGKLPKLRELWAFENQLSELPPNLLNLARQGTLEELYLHGNSKLDLPEAILGAHWEQVAWKDAEPTPPLEILEYYFAMRGGPARTLREFKVILVGRGEVGKTTIAKALQGQPFEKARPMTKGISITPWEIDLQDGHEDGKATAYLWDFGGQQIMHGTHQFFMTHRALYLVVLDGRDDRTKQEAEYWLKLVRAFGGSASPVLLVLNKQGDCPYEIDGEHFVKKYGIMPQHIFRTECSDPQNAGLAALRRSICEEAARLLANRELFPGAWWEMKNHLAEMRTRSEDFLSEEQYHELCRRMKVPVEQCGSLLRALSELGVVVSFPDDVSLSHLLVLNPEWVTDGVYRVLNDHELREKKRGQLSLTALEKILPASRWRKHGHRKYILDLMEKFELCFPMEGRNNTVLVPELLQDATPSNLDAWQADECVVFLYKYPALPQGVLPRFITRTHEMSEGQERWRSGVVLKRQGSLALVRADYDRNELYIWVRGRPGPANREFMAIIREHLDAIHGRFENLGEEALLTVPGRPDVTVLLQDVLADEEGGEKTMRLTIAGARCEVPIKDLLEGVDIKRDRKKRKLDREIGHARKHADGGNIIIKKAVFDHSHKTYTHMKEDKSSKVIVGAGATVSGIIGKRSAITGSTGNTQTFSHSFNADGRPPAEKDDIKAAVDELSREAKTLLAKLEEKEQARLQKNLTIVTEEAAAEEPDGKLMQVSAEGLIKAAQTCAAMAGPVVAATKKVLELFL